MAKAPKPIKPEGEALELAVPPNPVAGAPTGMIDTVVVVTGEVVVVPPAVVVVVPPAVVVVVPPAVVVVPPAVVVVPPAVVVVVGGAAEHVEASMVFALSVTPPVWARTRPCTVALLRSEIDVNAIIDPLKFVVEPSVADEPRWEEHT